jgi:hypothetical protein
MSSKDQSSGKVADGLAETFTEPSTDEPEILSLTETEIDALGRESDGCPVGAVYHCEPYDEQVYYSRREEDRHFYNKGKGYAIDDKILSELESMGVETVFIGLDKSESVLEFELAQYTSQDTFEHGNYGVQRCAPKKSATKTWPNAMRTLFDSASYT